MGEFGFDEGIDVVNDISGGDFDENLLKTVANQNFHYILNAQQFLLTKICTKKNSLRRYYSFELFFSKKNQ